MTDWQIPLLVSTGVFAAYLVFKFRPAVGKRGRATAVALKGATARIEAARDDAARAEALADAADACLHLGRTNGAVGYYLRALRTDPSSKIIVERAATAFARRPMALEKLLWRHLGGGGWTSDAGGREAAIASLRALAEIYGRRPRTQVRGRALAHVLEALVEGR
jgi:tetratricopeptide (TPR) repeat protein